ncbi:response regulator transcription factor [Mycobacterium sherrisii]|uniref:response regulator transcription factor n=1 Tax=Mycobacterium sherrisii TaxID=243061 RepID=UPI0009FC1A90|nr:response regulator [Mycobacterium sherrisii]
MGATVVIIDDDERFRALIRNLLNRRGFSVVAATADGTSGVAAVDRYHPDCALIDVHLPDADGYELAGCATATQSWRCSWSQPTPMLPMYPACASWPRTA